MSREEVNKGCVLCRFTVDAHGQGHHAPNCPTLKRKRPRTIVHELIGKTIQAAKFKHDLDAPVIELEFTDGTSFSLISEARPKVAVCLFFSAKDGDEIREELDEV
jgi:hypothetical protein